MAFTVAPTPASAQRTDILVLYNGDHITGEIRSLHHGKLSYKTDDMGTLSIEWDEVARIRSVNVHEVVLVSGRRVFGPLHAPTEDGKLVVDPDTLSMSSVVEITPIEAGFVKRTDGYVDLGFTFAKANAATTLHMDWQAHFRGPTWGGTIEGSSYLQRQDDADPTSRNHGALSAKRLVTGKVAGLAFFQATQNDELNLNLRTNLGIGVDYRVVHSNRFEFGLVGGILTNRERFADADSAIVSAEIITQMDFSAFRYDSPELDFGTTLTPYFSVTKLGRVRIDLEIRWVYEIFDDFSFGIKFRDSFDSDPPDAAAIKNDYTTTFSIGWSWN